MARLWVPHRCLQAPDLHEVFYRRNDLPKSRQGYMVDRHNVVTACNTVHITEANREAFTYCAAMVLCGIYSEESVRFYLETAPFKTKTSLDGVLAYPGPIPEGWRVARQVLLRSIGERINRRAP
jgi:hypothetical protein